MAKTLRSTEKNNLQISGTNTKEFLKKPPEPPLKKNQEYHFTSGVRKQNANTKRFNPDTTVKISYKK
ncbi:MAG: hypothetical protein IPG79_11350 [Saprospiraceae bacterium]|nr:hypothetical protein [Saprospiraceae bacterium]